MKNGQISTTALILISGENPNYRIYDVGVPMSGPKLAKTTRANDMDENNWVGFWVKTEHSANSLLKISIGKEGIADPILAADLTGWGSKAPTHVSFSFGQDPVKYSELRGKDASIEPSTCSAKLLGEIDKPAPSLTEPVVVGEECEEGVRGRFVLVQKEIATVADMWFYKVLVNHTEEGKIANAD